MLVSVPYRGATFLNTASVYCSNKSLFVSVPYRGATFLNGTGSSPSSPLYLVSVPYRGATFLNHSSSSSLISLSVSVPYRGATFLNGKGEKFYEYDESFRPLSGSYISQFFNGFNFFFLVCLFPSPIGELHFSIPSPQPQSLSGTN